MNTFQRINSELIITVNSHDDITIGNGETGTTGQQ